MPRAVHLECLPSGKSILTMSEWYINAQRWVWYCLAERYTMADLTMYKAPHGLSDCIDRYIWVVKQTIRYIHCWLERCMDQLTFCGSMLHQVISSSYSLKIIMWIQIPTGLNLKLNIWYTCLAVRRFVEVYWLINVMYNHPQRARVRVCGTSELSSKQV